MDRLISMTKYFLVAILACTANAAFADEQFTVTGSMTSVDDMLTGVSTQGGTFQAIVHYDSSLPGTTMTSFFGSNGKWPDSVTEISYTVYDASGNQTYTADLLSTSSDPAVTAAGVTTTQVSGTSQTEGWAVSDSDGSSSESATISFNDPAGQLFVDYSSYPDPTQLTGHTGTFNFSSIASDHQLYGVGTIDSITFGPVDTDGDGVADNVDQCPNSILTPTVVFHGRDTGIPNTLQPDGCTLMDMLAAGERPVSWMKKHGLKHHESDARHHGSRGDHGRDDRDNDHGHHYGRDHDHDNSRSHDWH